MAPENPTLSSLDLAVQGLGPSFRLQQQMEKFLEPQRRLQEAIEKYLEPQRQLREQMRNYSEPQRQLEEYITKYLRPQHVLQEQIRKLLEPQHQIQEHIRKLLEPQRRLQEQMTKYFVPQRQLEAQIKQFLEPQRLLQEQAARHLQSLNQYLADSSIAIVTVDKSGFLSVGNERLSPEVIEEHVASFSEKSFVGIQFIDVLFEWLEKIGPTARAAVMYLILPYILAIVANLTTPILQEWWKSVQDLEPRVAKKQIINAANELYPAQGLREYRFVAVKVLNVRESGSQTSVIVDELYLGRTVKLIERRKQWSFVEYFDEHSNSVKRGWVFSRYLAKFER